MAVITVPTGLLFGLFEPGQQRYDLTAMSEATGDVRDRIVAPPRWTFRIGPPTPGAPYEQAALWRAMIASLQGSVNYLALYNPAEPAPRGTMRGAPTVSGTLAKGATSITLAVSGQNGTTVLAGDAFQIGTGLGSQYIYATSNGTVSGGAVTFSFQAPARVQFAAGTAVTWDKPVVNCKMKTAAPSWSYTPGAFLAGGAVIDLVEHWEH